MPVERQIKPRSDARKPDALDVQQRGIVGAFDIETDTRQIERWLGLEANAVSLADDLADADGDARLDVLSQPALLSLPAKRLAELEQDFSLLFAFLLSAFRFSGQGFILDLELDADLLLQIEAELRCFLKKLYFSWCFSPIFFAL